MNTKCTKSFQNKINLLQLKIRSNFITKGFIFFFFYHRPLWKIFFLILGVFLKKMILCFCFFLSDLWPSVLPRIYQVTINNNSIFNFGKLIKRVFLFWKFPFYFVFVFYLSFFFKFCVRGEGGGLKDWSKNFKRFLI